MVARDLSYCSGASVHCTIMVAGGTYDAVGFTAPVLPQCNSLLLKYCCTETAGALSSVAGPKRKQGCFGGLLAHTPGLMVAG